MKPRLVLIGLFAAMALPYLSLIVVSDYFSYVWLVVKMLAEVRLHSISALMALASVAAYIFRVSRGSGAVQDSSIIATLTIPVVLPSLLMVGLLLTPMQEQLPAYFSSAADLYLVGIASLSIVLPLLCIVNQASIMFLNKGSAASAVLMTMVCYGLVAFVGVVGSGQLPPEGSSKGLQVMGARILVDFYAFIQLMLSNILGFEQLTASPVGSVPWLASPDRILTATIFALASAIYFYYRLYQQRAEEEGALTLVKSGGPMAASLHSIGFAIFAAVLIDAGLILAILLTTQQLQLAVELSIVLMMAMIMIFGFADRLMPRWFRG
ncbi:MAG: hypothetical protein HYY67_05755 [Thaumarchaeota archaeon]|nr:hypothetical protein [Nitrososphaerota archaeon]